MKKLFMLTAVAIISFTQFSCNCDKDINFDKGKKKLATPEATVAVSGKTAIISWEAIDNAESYVIDILSRSFTISKDQLSKTIENLATGSYTATIKAVAAEGSTDYINSDEATFSFVIEAQKLATPVATAAVQGSNASISWGAIDNASSYSITLGTETYTANANDTSYTIEDLAVGTYTGTIKAVPAVGSTDFLNSDEAAFTFVIAELENNITINGIEYKINDQTISFADNKLDISFTTNDAEIKGSIMISQSLINSSSVITTATTINDDEDVELFIGSLTNPDRYYRYADSFFGSIAVHDNGGGYISEDFTLQVSKDADTNELLVEATFVGSSLYFKTTLED